MDGITMSMVTTNFVLSLGLGAIFSPDDYFLPNKIWDGSISTELLRPISRIHPVVTSSAKALITLEGDDLRLLELELKASRLWGLMTPAPYPADGDMRNFVKK